MSSIHNDLHSWAGRARAKGHDTIEITVDFADKAVELIVSQAAEIDRLKSDRLFVIGFNEGWDAAGGPFLDAPTPTGPALIVGQGGRVGYPNGDPVVFAEPAPKPRVCHDCDGLPGSCHMNCGRSLNTGGGNANS